MLPSKYKIAVLGLWHLGEVFSAGLSELGHNVVGIDENKNVIDKFLENLPPLPEPNLIEIIAKNRAAGTLDYTTDISRVSDCDVVWLAFDTPVDDNDNVDLTILFKAFRSASAHLREDVLIVVSSQIPVGTSSEFIELVKQARPGLRFQYVYTPENLRLGEAIRCFMEPGRVVAGVSSPEALRKITEIFEPLKTEIVSMAPASAEMSKHAINAFLADCICFTNDLADIAERVGADMLDVSRALRSDPRIGSRAYVDAGLSFSGGTLNRDIKVLVGLSKKFNIDPSVVESLYNKNEARKNLVPQRLEQALGILSGKTIALLGLTYKPGTKTLRRSHPLEVARVLIKSGVTVRLHDPQAEQEGIGLDRAVFSRDPYEAAENAAAIVLMTPWPDFKKLDFNKLGAKTPGALFFDTANLLWEREDEIKKAGFKYQGIGRPQTK